MNTWPLPTPIAQPAQPRPSRFAAIPLQDPQAAAKWLQLDNPTLHALWEQASSRSSAGSSTTSAT
ncbi:hypothetical protein [Amycolatopsis sp. H20-H5]|uniref:hypothetical protein n=1 Tax=Amycolatopsis sp. H20-H5 TaxID=3046309 RepID=UPI002DB8C1BB|nr:hypothetical protein [Amycolatopsis sp. H20-H5]MEC3974465.1 hypothetical protein [Amycolatopsis sp. H20-H5]